MMYHHTKFDRSEILSRQTFTEVQNLHCDLDLEYSKATFSQDTPAYEHALSNSPYCIWLQMVQRCISSKLTLSEIFNIGCDIDLEHSKPTFSLDTSLLMMIYTQIEFGCKRLTRLELIKDIVETVMF